MAANAQKAEIERLEKAFWKSIVDGQPETATELLTEPALMISGHGVNKFDHAAYTKMATSDRMKLIDYSLSDMDVLFPTDDVAIATYRATQKVQADGRTMQMEVYDSSTWIKVDAQWQCVMHTESPVASSH